MIRAMVSKEASFFRQQLCRVIADILHQWMFESLGSRVSVTQNNSQLTLARGTDNGDLGSSSKLSTASYDYQSFLRDKRLKVIFLKVLDPVRRDPVLMLRLCWSSFVIFVTASALAFHRLLVSLSEAHRGSISLFPKRFAISASNS